jgi:3-dehydroquinate dehydratase I
MMTRRSTKRCPQVVGVIASRADLECAVRMGRPPDLFELRLDRLGGTARDPHEGGANKLRLRQRRDLFARFLNHADYIDVELRSARALQALLAIAKTKNIRRIISFHNFKSTPSARLLVAKAHNAKALRADIFKVATRTDTPMELGRLLEFTTKNRVNVRLAVMGIGRLGAISRVLLVRAGSVLIYASVGAASDVEGQMSLKQLRALGFGL